MTAPEHPMPARFEEIGASDVEPLVAWLPQHSWPYHEYQRVEEAWIREHVAAGHFFGPGAKSFWVLEDGAAPIGIVRILELTDTTPLLDIRLVDVARGRGLGAVVVRWVTSFVFQNSPETHRFGGYTRVDNRPMRRVFEKCGFVQEARHRRAWKAHDGTYVDAIGYAALRSDWLSGTITPVLWP